jgi:hypothetical protein
MDNVQNCDSYINIPSAQACRIYMQISAEYKLRTMDFVNHILFAICTSTFSKLCVSYTVACRREICSAPL